MKQKIFSVQDSRRVAITHGSISHVSSCYKPTDSKYCYLMPSHKICTEKFVLETIVRIYLNAPFLRTGKYNT
jgi:hypothetical protein